MKKVVFLINTLTMGGAEHALIDIANALDKNEFKVTIKTLYDINFFSDIIDSNVEVKSYYKTKKNKFVDKVFRKLAYFKFKYLSSSMLCRMVIKEKYDIEVAFLEGLPTRIISGSTSGAKKIAWVHCDFGINRDSDCFFKNFDDQKESYSKFDEIYCVSDKSKESFKEVFGISKNTFVMHNIIDSELIRRKSLEDAELSDNFNIISVGRLTEQKSYERLIEAYSKALKSLKKETHLYIVGEGEERKKIETAISAFKLNDRVTLLGKQSNPYKYVSKCQLYVCSSKSEGYSLVIREALVLGIPILSTNCINEKEVFDGEDFGLIVDNNVEELMNGLINLINNEKLLDEYRINIKKKYKQSNEIKKIEEQLLK